MGCILCQDFTPYKRLRILRILLDFKQQSFADFLGISVVTYQKYENNEFKMSMELKEKFRYVGINAQWIDYGTGDPFSIERELVIKNILRNIKNTKP